MPGVDRWKRRALRRQSGLPVCSCACARITAAKRLASKLCCGRSPSGGRLSIRTTVDLIGATDLARWRMFEISSTPSATAPQINFLRNLTRAHCPLPLALFVEDLCTSGRGRLAATFSDGAVFSGALYHGSLVHIESQNSKHLYGTKFEVLSMPKWKET